MSNTPATLDPTPATKSTASTSKKLIRAAALAALLVPLGSVAVETAPINCGFGTYYGGFSGCTGSSPTASTFDWGDYAFFLEFQGVEGTFNIGITDASMTQAAFAVRAAGLGDYDPVPMVDSTDPYRDFQIFKSGTGTFTGYDLEIRWNFDTNEAFPDTFGGTDGHVRVLQNPGSDDPVDFYTIDMCEMFGCEYFPAPFPGDPVIRSGDTDFSSMTVAWTPVPEPGTLALLGSGLTGLVCRYRRRRQRPEAEPTP